MSVPLKTGGWNIVVYPGKAQLASDAFASISSYLTLIYYWNNVTYEYQLVGGTTMMVPYGVYAIEVTQDCTWTYGPDEIPPSSVQLYAREGGNIVPYCGKAIPPADALAPILPYLLPTVFIFNNATQKWDVVSNVLGGPREYYQSLIVPNGVYYMGVSQNCVWTFVAAPAVAGELVAGYVWWEGKAEWNTIGETNNWPANTPISTAWTVENTGSQAAVFKVKFIGLTSSGVQLSPGEEATFYLYPTTPSAGTYSYTLSILAADQVVKTSPIQVTTVAVPTEPEFAGFNISDYSKV